MKHLICKNCGHIEDDHYTVNYSVGNLVAKNILICPTSVFIVKEKEK